MLHFDKVFKTPLELKERLIESFHDHVPGIPEIDKFSIGFFETGRNSGKRWIVSTEDLDRMYSKFESGSEIPLWCDGKTEITGRKKRSSDTIRDSDPEEAPLSKYKKSFIKTWH